LKQEGRWIIHRVEKLFFGQHFFWCISGFDFSKNPHKGKRICNFWWNILVISFDYLISRRIFWFVWLFLVGTNTFRLTTKNGQSYCFIYNDNNCNLLHYKLHWWNTQVIIVLKEQITYYYPDWVYLVDLFFNPALKNYWHSWWQTKKMLTFPIFCTTKFFPVQAQSLFKQAAISLSFLRCHISHSKQSALVFIHALLFVTIQFYPIPRGQIFLLIRFFISGLLYVIAPCCYQQTVQYWYFSWFGRSSLGFRSSCHHL